jgi:hypothetical protein
LKLGKHIKGGGRLSLTTDTWSSRNYKSFTAVTGHWIDSNWVQHSQLLDIIELTDPVHSREYLAEKLSEITNSLKITKVVFTITRDNAAPNNTMLCNFEAAASFYEDDNSLQQPWSYTCKEGDVRCLGHIINLAVQEALKQLKAVPSDESEDYRMDANAARIPILHTQDEVVSALSKLRRHVYIFRNRRAFKVKLEQQLKAMGLKQRLLVLDMPVRWNSTSNMISIASSQESPITAVCASQTIDLSVRDIMLNQSDWVILHKLHEFFQIFVHPTKKLQASMYPTLNYVIPQYIKMIKRVTEKQVEWGAGSPLGIACQKALDKLNEYYNGLHSHVHASIATICDPRFNFNVFNILMPSLADNAKKAMIKSGFKTAFYKYQEREVAIKDARFRKEQEDASEIQPDDDNEEDELSDAELYQSGPLDVETETELTRYLKLPAMPRETNIYLYWKAKQYDYPIISRIAADYLAIPATSAPLESVFSIGSDVVTKKRNKLTGDSVRMIMCLKDWGIITDEDIDDEEEEGREI